MIEDIKILSYSDNLIDNNSLLSYLLNKTNLINNPDIPAFLHSLTKSSVMKLITSLDQNYTGSVNIKHLLTYLSYHYYHLIYLVFSTLLSLNSMIIFSMSSSCFLFQMISYHSHKINSHNQMLSLIFMNLNNA
jgi:hypothetical protein